MFCHVKIHSTFVCSLITEVSVTFRSTQYCQCGFVVIVQKYIKIYIYSVAGSSVGAAPAHMGVQFLFIVPRGPRACRY